MNAQCSGMGPRCSGLGRRGSRVHGSSWENWNSDCGSHHNTSHRCPSFAFITTSTSDSVSPLLNYVFVVLILLGAASAPAGCLLVLSRLVFPLLLRPPLILVDAPRALLGPDSSLSRLRGTRGYTRGARYSTLDPVRTRRLPLASLRPTRGSTLLAEGLVQDVGRISGYREPGPGTRGFKTPRAQSRDSGTRVAGLGAARLRTFCFIY